MRTLDCGDSDIEHGGRGVGETTNKGLNMRK